MSVQISVIITTFNRPNNLKRAIESIINQSFESWELIVVDDNNPNTESRQLTEKIMSNYCRIDSRIKYIQHEFNKNGSAARNTGIKKAKGRYISFLDDDDFYLKDKLIKQYEIMEKAELQYGGVYSGCNFIRRDKVVKTLENIYTGNFLTETLSCSFKMGSGSNLFIRSDVINELEGFDESFDRHQDYEFLVRFFERYNLIGINEILFSVDQSDNHSNIPNTEKLYSVKKKYLEKYKYILEKLDNRECNNIYYQQALELCESAIREKKYKLCKKYIKEANRHKNINIRRLVRLFMLLLYNNIPKNLRRMLLKGKV